jgi:hypothetical protein
LPEVGDQWLGLMFVTTLPLAVLGVGMLVTARMSTRPDVNIHRSPGVRTDVTLRSRDAWLAAHRAVKRPTRIGGYMLLGSSIIDAFVGVSWDVRYAIVIELIALLTLPLFGLWVLRVAHEAARARGAP